MLKRKHTLPVLLVLNLFLTLIIVVLLLTSYPNPGTSFPEAEEEFTYTLYIGLNDKDSYSQLISTEDARAIVDDVLTALNQSSILARIDTVQTVFYSGSENQQ